MLNHSLFQRQQIEYSHHPRCNIGVLLSIYVQLVHPLNSQQSISIDNKNLMIENEEQNDRIENLPEANSTFR